MVRERHNNLPQQIVDLDDHVKRYTEFVIDDNIGVIQNMVSVWNESDWLVFTVAKDYALSNDREDTILEADKVLTRMIKRQEEGELRRRVERFYFIINLPPQAVDVISTFDPLNNIQTVSGL